MCSDFSQRRKRTRKSDGAYTLAHCNYKVLFSRVFLFFKFTMSTKCSFVLKRENNFLLSKIWLAPSPRKLRRNGTGVYVTSASFIDYSITPQNEGEKKEILKKGSTIALRKQANSLNLFLPVSFALPFHKNFK